MRGKMGKALIAADSLKNWLLKSKYVQHEGKKHILIIFRDYGIGDAVCFLPVLKKLPELYPAEAGYSLHLAADEQTLFFWKKFLALPKIIELLPLRLHNRDSFRDFRVNRKLLETYSWEQVLFFHPMGTYYRLLLAGLPCAKIIAESGELDLPGQRLDVLLPSLQVLEHPAKTMVFQAYEALLRLASGQSVALDYPYIEPLGHPPELDVEGDYCVVSCGVATGHANGFRAWPLERFAEVMSYIGNKLGLNIVLSGSAGERSEVERLLGLLPDDLRKRVHNLVGHTNFEAWVELIRGARFVFGNDSGYIHVAAAVHTQAFFIMGNHNYGRFFPYRFSEEIVDREGGYEPCMIETPERPACVFCNCPWLLADRSGALAAKSSCDQWATEKGVYRCVDEIQSAQAIKVIRNWYSARQGGVQQKI